LSKIIQSIGLTELFASATNKFGMILKKSTLWKVLIANF